MVSMYDADGKLLVNPQATPRGGASKLKARNLGATLVSVKASPASFYGLQVLNLSGAAAYIQLFDALAASVTLGTTTPDLEFSVGSAQALNLWFGEPGVSFASGIVIAATTMEAGAVGSANGVTAFVEYA